MTRRAGPGRLHVLTVEPGGRGLSHRALAELAARAGADVVQFREKRGWTTAELVRGAREIAACVREHGVRLVVNDRPDVAAAAGADGVHLGASDPAPAEARRLLGRAAWIGRTVNGLDEARAAARAVEVDYFGVGPVFATASKAGAAPALGLAGLRRIVEALDRPVIAIGGIVAERVCEVLAAGAYGVAVLSAVAASEDPAGQVARLRRAIDDFVERVDAAAIARSR
jgi:thiamine-phosphate pyrophosphorylase